MNLIRLIIVLLILSSCAIERPAVHKHEGWVMSKKLKDGQCILKKNDEIKVLFIPNYYLYRYNEGETIK